MQAEYSTSIGQGHIKTCSFAQILEVIAQLSQASKEHWTLFPMASTSSSYFVSSLTDSVDKRHYMENLKQASKQANFIHPFINLVNLDPNV